MGDSYSLYEAKARLSAIIRRVREGRPVTITLHGEPVAEIRAIQDQGEGIEKRVTRLVERGVLVPAESDPAEIPVAVRRRGALKRFLAERDE
jgi:prevent-host-death family protein